MSAEWYCRSDGMESGPLSATQLRQLANAGQLSTADFVRKGAAGDWVQATLVKGLFEAATATLPARTLPEMRLSGQQVLPINGDASRTASPPHLARINSVQQCISREERKHRLGVTIVNLLIWLTLLLLAVASMGMLVLLYLAGKVLAAFFSEYNVRRLQALGTAVSDRQFPEIHQAMSDVCKQFQVKQAPRIIVLNESATNAFAIKFARHKVIVLLSQTLEGVLNEPAELRFLLAHEMAHIVLDHGLRGDFEIVKSAAYKAARELTCDNCGVAAAGDLESAKTLLKRLGVGNQLYPNLSEDVLLEESNYLYSGFSGWLLKRHLTYPPLGKRIANVAAFAQPA